MSNTDDDAALAAAEYDDGTLEMVEKWARALRNRADAGMAEKAVAIARRRGKALEKAKAKSRELREKLERVQYALSCDMSWLQEIMNDEAAIADAEKGEKA